MHGVLCLGGAEGALLGAAAMHALPVGVPKLIVSPSASGRRAFGPFVGEGDVTVMHSVIDILGLNEISRAIFDNAAAAIVGMARDGGRPVGELGEKCVGITMLGQTTPGVMRVRDALVDAGHEPVIFHANGVGGPAMEHLIEAGALGGVIDYTLSELANSLLDGIHATGPDRLRVAGRHGLPQVVVPGCVDFFNQGAARHAARALPRRARATSTTRSPRSCGSTAEEEADARPASSPSGSTRRAGRCAWSRPTRGFSLADAEGGDLWDPEADRAFLDSLRDALRPDIPYETVDAHVDDAGVRRRRRRALPDPDPGARPCRMTAVPSRTTCSTSRRRTSRGSRSARTSSWSRSARSSSTARTCRSGTDTITALEVSRRAAAKADVPVHAAVLGRLLAAAPARHRVRASARSRCARARSTRCSTTSRAR